MTKKSQGAAELVSELGPETFNYSWPKYGILMNIRIQLSTC